MNDLLEKLEHLAWLKRRAKRSMAAAEARKDAAKEFEAELFGVMDDLGLTSLNTRQHTFVPKTTVRSYVTNAEEFRRWLEENDLVSEFLKDEPQKARLNELVRDRLDRKQELPPGVAWYPQQYISTTER